MGYAPKIVLELPISDPALLAPFVEACLCDRVELIAVVGEGCAELEDLIDWITVGDGSNDSRFIVTTSHPGETLAHVLEFASAWEIEGRDGVQIVKL